MLITHKKCSWPWLYIKCSLFDDLMFFLSVNELFSSSYVWRFILSQCNIQLWNRTLVIASLCYSHHGPESWGHSCLATCWREISAKILPGEFFFPLDLLEHLIQGVFVLILYRFQSARTKALRLLCLSILHHLLGIFQRWCCMDDLFSSVWLDNSCLFDGRVLDLIAFVQSVTHC